MSRVRRLSEFPKLCVNEYKGELIFVRILSYSPQVHEIALYVLDGGTAFSWTLILGR